MLDCVSYNSTLFWSNLVVKIIVAGMWLLSLLIISLSLESD